MITAKLENRPPKINVKCQYGELFFKHYRQMLNLGTASKAFFVDLRPKSTAMVMAGRSVYLTTLFLGQA